MEHARYSAIGHGGLAILNPIGAADLDRMLARLALRAGDSAIDFGCGKGEMLLRLIEQAPIRAVGVDLNAVFLADARAAAARRAPHAAASFVEASAGEYSDGHGTFDAALAVGATHVFGGLRPTLAALAGWVRPGGRVLVGEGYWKREPAAEYLAAIDGARDEFGTHEDNAAAGASAVLARVDACERALDDWDRYEGTYAANLERFAAEHPDDPDRDAILARIRPWRAAYLAWGRETLGFGLYLFRRPD